VDVVLTGHIGRKASGLLKAAGVRVFLGASGRVREAIEGFKGGRYREM
jgi:predicted Fe-Mo cluster-binding NifX family protein